MSDNPFSEDFTGDLLSSDPTPAPAAAKVGKGPVHHEVEQGSIEWHNLRCGILTASEMKLIITPGLAVANNDAVKTHLYELLAQRVTKYVEPHFESYDMERGKFDEDHARAKYSEKFGDVVECGFITNDRLGFNIGYSPDGLVGDDGLIEVKSRVQKHQMKTLVEYVANNQIPPDYIIQCQTGLFIAERKWLDFVSYSGGMPMPAVRCYPDPRIQDAIADAATTFEARLAEKLEIYENLLASNARLVPTERLLML